MAQDMSTVSAQNMLDSRQAKKKLSHVTEKDSQEVLLHILERNQLKYQINHL